MSGILQRIPLVNRIAGETPVVSVLRLHGPIGMPSRLRQDLSIASTAKLIHQAFSVRGVKAVALSINSPGGSPVQSALIMKRIRDLAKEKDVPVLAFAEDVAASGGYMLALAGDEIFAHDASIIGSIGVVAAGFGFPELLARFGIERRLYTAGENKARLDPFSPEQEDDVARIKDLQGQIHTYFKDIVKSRRGKRLKGTQKKLFSGDIWVGDEAVKLGLIDGIGDLREVTRERFGEDVRLKVIEAKKSRVTSILGMSAHSAVGAGTARAFDGIGDTVIAAAEERLMWSRFGL